MGFFALEGPRLPLMFAIQFVEMDLWWALKTAMTFQKMGMDVLQDANQEHFQLGFVQEGRILAQQRVFQNAKMVCV